ncbi:MULTISPECIES: hypothetical protein [Rhizobium]|jgi:regulator of nucleoside diphosphate kinase|uniref:Uncharacterized protein n=6 Tax=Rhizobium TaxID=379 RepID=A0A2A6J6S3_9HYPH|nr:MULTISPECIES: hypothetical protein [Rhizobium]ARM14864.1 hypothetical protein Bra5_PB00113 [Rhizobium phaseoli Brasil 5]MBB4332383.1 hypothetical protein [Rhizobium leguminosarum]MBB4357368.1 hypothetical protein [Rhizobium leguminosarum]MBB4510159.1 hypothetical protein [Rhizobium leguminosarum]MBB4552023.1 hypothetical protein [Rhizobium leguminosarum]
MASAIAMLREDLPEEVASLHSRVIFSIDGRGDALVLTTGRMTTPSEYFARHFNMPVNTPH